MVLHFKSKKAYKKWNAFRHIHGMTKGGRQKVIIAGHVHKVKHTGR